ncbi:MAG TPA: cyclopropane-fatty-acyl-phospholipid synthase family protein [Candidatus Saccharimonadia bacterium]|nr:cyclopropane-fatty-acyl-phospholipid synthase family protein [Candidatus Saccharimonadia bacterium]
MEKFLLDRLLRRLRQGGVKIRYWDGDERVYGPARPYLTIHYKSPAAVRGVIKNLSLGLGEGYMNGLIDFDGPIAKLIQLGDENTAAVAGFSLKALTSRPQRNHKSAQARQIQHHYDLGNDFYRLWLDRSLTYSCAYFATPADDLEAAQQHKLDHVLRKLQLQSGQRLLDIGSGWGGLLIAAAQRYGATGLGITLSREQLAGARQAAAKAGVADRVTFELMNYQDLAATSQRFDRIVSVGMYEHVGRHNHASYFAAVDRLLADGGLTVLHTISQQQELPNDPWIDRYIFPGGYLPTIAGTVAYATNHNFRLLDYENLRLHYALTLEAWLNRFESHSSQIKAMYDERFVRMWRFYLSVSAGSFRYGGLDLSQFVFSKGRRNDLPLTRDFLYQPDHEAL